MEKYINLIFVHVYCIDHAHRPCKIRIFQLTTHEYRGAELSPPFLTFCLHIHFQ